MAAKRILFVVNAAWFFVSHRLHLAIAARNEGYDIHIAATKDKSVVNIEQTGLTFHDIPFSRKRLNPVTELITIFKLLVLYIRINPDLVHHVTIKPVIYGSFVAKLINITAIVNAISGLGYVFTTKGFIASIR